MLKVHSLVIPFALLGFACYAQQPAAKPTDRVVGVITAVDATGGKLAVTEDKTNAAFDVSIADTKTFLKVGLDLNLKNATRLTPSQLAVGDRVSIRGTKAGPGSNAMQAASVLVMSATDVAQKRSADAADWKQRGVAGIVASVDAPGNKLTMTVRSADGPKPVAVDLQKVTDYTRYSPDTPKTPLESKLADIQTGDQVRVLGTKNEDGSMIAAERVYSGSFRTVAATVASISPDGKELTINDLQTKQPVKVSLNDDSSIRKMPLMMANMMAMRLNPNFKAAGAGAGPGGAGAGPGGTGPGNGPSRDGASQAGAGAGNPSAGAAAPRMTDAGAPQGGNAGGPGGPGGPGAPGTGGLGAGMRNGDLSQMLERLPKIPITDLKPGDAVVVSGGAGSDKSRIVASNIVAGVEPLFQSAPPRAGQQSAVSGAWNFDLSIPGQ